MNIFNVFRLDNMPSDEQEQNLVVEKMFTVRNMHVHGEDGYFLVRCTSFDTVDDVTATKLDPSTDQELMRELVEIFLANEDKLS